MSVDTSHDQLLANLIDQLITMRRAGTEPDVDALARLHPEVAEEMRSLWAAVQYAEEFAPSRNGPSTSTLPLRPPEPGGASPLPRRFGDYELLERIGQGGMGVVYKARQLSLNRVVAVKMIRRGDHASAEELARFQDEARATARLDSQANIAPVYEVGVCDGQAYFSMKYIEGRTLADLLAEGPLPPQEAARLMVEICRAVDHAHAHGILHRDLKPSNILLDRAGRPHVTDFGLAKRPRLDGESSLTQTGAIVGTPAYMSPEQAFGNRALTPASDVYSLGTMLYEMLTGRPPFRAASVLDTLLLVREQPPVAPRQLNPAVDPDLEMITLQCLQKAPEARYQSAKDLAADLEAFREGRPPSVRSTSISSFIRRMLSDTPYAPVLENWGLLWMWHSLKLFLLCLATNVMLWCRVESPLPYLLLWSLGLVIWGTIFWRLRKAGGPVLFIERQIAHVWASAVIATISIFVIEMLLHLKVLTLSPILAVVASMVFVVKGGMLSGSFYLAAGALLATAIPMALFPEVGPLLFGITSAGCFFIPGLKYYRQRLRTASSRSA